MPINIDSIISNTKGTANIAKLKLTLGLRINELNNLYEELGKLFYEYTKNNQTKTESTNSSFVDYSSDEKIQACLEKIPSVEQEVETLESQILNEKDNMKPISTPTQNEYSQTNYTQDFTSSTESGVKCPKCGAIQSSDNEFCMNCGTKINRD